MKTRPKRLREIPTLFYHVLGNTAVANLTTNFLWFAIVFWVYLETRNILATGFLGGAYMLLIAACSMWFGTMIDRARKHRAMLISGWWSFTTFTAGGIIYVLVPHENLLNIENPWFWIFTLVMLLGCVVELLRNLALSTMVTLLVPSERHAQANGLVGAVQGMAFIATSVLSGISIGQLGMGPTILIATLFTLVPLLHLHTLRIPEPAAPEEPETHRVDFRGGIRAVLVVPGLVGLILFTMLNNLTGGVYMALLDPYGLELFSVEMWGITFGVASTGFIIGGLVVAKRGLGSHPLRVMLLLVIVLGVLGSAFAIRESQWLLITGIWVFMALMPAIEAAEQTVIQRVVPYDHQGRVFGLAMTCEAAAAPITSFLIAPIAEFWVVPYMRTTAGQEQWGWLLGEGTTRGIALIFVATGLAMIVLGGGAFLTRSYTLLTKSYSTTTPQVPTQLQ